MFVNVKMGLITNMTKGAFVRNERQLCLKKDFCTVSSSFNAASYFPFFMSPFTFNSMAT